MISFPYLLLICRPILPHQSLCLLPGKQILLCEFLRNYFHCLSEFPSRLYQNLNPMIPFSLNSFFNSLLYSTLFH